MTETIQRYINTNSSYHIRTQQLQGRDNIIVPVVMMVEGVHSGSGGAVLHTAEELGKIAGAWNGIPVVINHPKQNGANVSANSPEVLEQSVVGKIFNAHMDGVKLKAECWIETDLISNISSETLAMIRNGNNIDVSVGIFSEDIDETGEFQGLTYEHIATNYRPDHLALLPEDTGACSWAEGCGIRLNKQEGGEKKMERRKNGKLNVFKKADDFSAFLVTNSTGYATLVHTIQRKLDGMDRDGRSYYLREVYDDTIIYHVSLRDGENTMYKRGYTTSESGVVEFANDYVEVKENTEYLEVNKLKTNEKGETIMSEKKVEVCTACVEKKANDLIANELTVFVEADKEWLTTQTEEKLDKLNIKPVEKKIEVNKEEKPLTAKDAMDVLKDNIKNPEQFIQLLPKEMQETLTDSMKMYADQRTSMITAIVANTEEVWTEADLKGMKTDTLKKVYISSVPKEKETDFSLFGTNSKPELETNTEAPLMPSDYVAKKE